MSRHHRNYDPDKVSPWKWRIEFWVKLLALLGALFTAALLWSQIYLDRANSDTADVAAMKISDYERNQDKQFLAILDEIKVLNLRLDRSVGKSDVISLPTGQENKALEDLNVLAKIVPIRSVDRGEDTSHPKISNPNLLKRCTDWLIFTVGRGNISNDDPLVQANEAQGVFLFLLAGITAISTGLDCGLLLVERVRRKHP